MPQLILVKHALPEINPLESAHEWHLSEEGRQRAKSLAMKLEKYNPHVIISSKEHKARETATIVAGRLARPLDLVMGLEEHSRQKVKFESQERFETAVAQLFQQPDKLVFGEETANQALKRFSQAIESQLNRYPAQNLVVVSHGTVISLYVAHVAGMEPFPLWQRLGLPSFIVLSLPSKEIQLIEENA